MSNRPAVVVAILIALVAGCWFVLQRSGDPDRPNGPAAPAPAAGDTRADLVPAQGAAPATEAPAVGADTDTAVREPLPTGTGGADATLFVRGRLVDRQGQPRAGVDLQLLTWDGSLDFDGIPLPLGRDRRGPTATSDSGGRFAFGIAAGHSGTIDFAQRTLVFAAGQPTVKVARADVELGDLQVLRAATIAGVVRDQRGQPVAEVQVAANQDGMPIGFRSSARTDAQGRFEVAGLHGGNWALRTASSNHLPAVQRVELGVEERRTGVEIVLEPGLAISGQVVDDRGWPAAGIKVGSRRRETRGEMSIERFTPDEATTTDANGYFTLAGLAGEAVTVRAFGSGYAPASAANVMVGTNDLQLVVQRLCSIAGVLRDTEGKPISGSRVTVRGDRGDRGARQDGGELFEPGEFEHVDDLGLDLPTGIVRAVTAGDGTFVVEGVRPGTVTVSATGRAHRPAQQGGVVVRPAQRLEGIALVAEIGAVVRARVVDDRGQAVANAKVVVNEPPQPTGGPRRVVRGMRVEAEADGPPMLFRSGDRQLGTATTDAQGIAEIPGLPGGPVEVNATHADLAAARPANLTLPVRGAVEAQLALRQPGLAALSVAGGDGAAVSGHYVVRGPLGVAGEEQQHAGSTDEAGLARVGPLVPGSYEATLRRPARAQEVGGVVFVGSEPEDLASTRVQFQVLAGEETAVSLRLPVLTRILGTVSGADGPCADVAIELERADEAGAPGASVPGGAQARSAADGTYAIDEVEPGRYLLRWGKPGQIVKARREVVVAQGQPELRADLELRYGKLRVQAVAKTDGAGIEGAEVELAAAGSGTGAQPQRRMMMISVQVTDSGAGESTTMTLDGARARTDRDGVAVIDDVPPGTYTVRIKHDAHTLRELPDQVVGEFATTDCGRVELAAAGRIRGRVVGAEGQPVGLALVRYRRLDDAGSEEREPAMGGTFTLRGLEPGRYALRAEQLGPEIGPAGAEVEVEVTAGKTAGGVELRVGGR